MRHHDNNRKFGRERNQRRALLKSLARSLILQGRMQTTLAKAKEIRPLIEKMLTRSKNPTLANRRLLISAIGEPATVTKLIATAENYTGRAGGYTRIVKLSPRKGDAAEMALIEFV